MFHRSALAGIVGLVACLPAAAQEMVFIDWYGTLIRTDLASGASTTSPAPMRLNGLARSDAGVLYAAGHGTQLYAIDACTGEFYSLGLCPIDSVRALAYRESNGLLYVSREVSATNELWTLDPRTLETEFKGLITGAFAQGMAFGANETLYGIFASLFILDPENGNVLGHIPDNPGGGQWLAFHESRLRAAGFDFVSLTVDVVDTTNGQRFSIGQMPLGSLRGAEFIEDLGCPGGQGAPFCAPSTPNSTGQAARLRVLGSGRIEGNSSVLAADRMPAIQLAYFVASRTAGFPHTPMGSQGTLCLGGNIARFPGRLPQTSPVGQAVLHLDLGTFPGGAIQPGETWGFQVWFRDGSSSNFSDGVAVSFF